MTGYVFSTFLIVHAQKATGKLPSISKRSYAAIVTFACHTLACHTLAIIRLTIFSLGNSCCMIEYGW